MPANSNNQDLLSSWKEIAGYLDCDERTCRRYELNFGLPIHRMEGTSKPRVYAYKGELDAWRKERLNGVLDKYRKELAAPKRRKLKAAKMLPWLLPFLAIIPAIFFLIRSSPGQPADFRILGSKLIVLDEKGRRLWEIETKLHNLISEQAYRVRFQVPSRFPLNETLLPFLVIRDINRDRKNEILFCPKTIDSFKETGLYCFSSNGNELWHYQADRELVFGEHTYSADYRIYGIELFDTNDDGNLEVFLFTGHIPHSPSGLVMLDCLGRTLGEFTNWGRFNDIACADLDADKKKEVIIIGMNDEYRCGFLAVFDSSRVSGSSPQSERYKCKNCGPGSEKYYILFPRTDVDKTLKPDKVSIDQILLLKNHRIQLQAQISHIFFELDFSLRVQDIKGSDSFRRQHRDLKAAGKITSVLDDAYYEELKSGVLYWDGTEWTSTPTMNRKWNNPR